MTDDLVKRLLEAARQFVGGECNLHARAADRIEELERHIELRDIFLVENDLWERFAKTAQVKTND